MEIRLLDYEDRKNHYEYHYIVRNKKELLARALEHIEFEDVPKLCEFAEKLDFEKEIAIFINGYGFEKY